MKTTLYMPNFLALLDSFKLRQREAYPITILLQNKRDIHLSKIHHYLIYIFIKENTKYRH